MTNEASKSFLLPPSSVVFSHFFDCCVGCRLSGVDVHCRLHLSEIAVGGWLSDGCRMLTMDCRVWLSVVVVGFWLSGCRCPALQHKYMQ